MTNMLLVSTRDLTWPLLAV